MQRTTDPPRVGLDVSEVPVAGGTHPADGFHLVAGGARNATVVVVGEAAGEPLQAAVRKAFATFSPYTDDPLNLLALVHGALSGKHDEGFTAVCVTFDPRSLRVRWASAGHPLPLVLETGEPVDAVAPLEESVGGATEPVGRTGELRLATGEGLVFRAQGLEPADRTAALRTLRGLSSTPGGAPAGDLRVVLLRATVPPRFESRSGPTRSRTAHGAAPPR